MSKAEASNITNPRRRHFAQSPLPFVKDAAPFSKHNVRRNFWHVASTGDCRLDAALGTAFGEKAIAHIRQDGFTPLLGWVIRDMIANREFGPIEIAFMDAFAKNIL